MSHFLSDGATTSFGSWFSGTSTNGLVADHTIAINSLGATLSGVFAALTIVFACALDRASKVAVDAADAGPTEKTRLKPQDDDHQELEPFVVRCLALAGSIAFLAGGTVAVCMTQQPAPLATAAIGVSLLFTLRPVQLGYPAYFPGGLALNMATAPWLCIMWQLAFGTMPLEVLVHGIQGEPGSKILPWTMLVTFVGAVYLCISLEATGGPSAAARAITNLCRGSLPKLFFCFAGLASCMTCLIPDDVVTMTLAPTICVLCNALRTDVEPHLYAQFYCANIFAVTLVTGNITNILVAGITHDTFLSFARIMVLPGLAAGCCSVVLLYLTFSSQLQKTAGADPCRSGDGTCELSAAVRYRIRSLVCLARLILAFAVAAFDGVHHWPIWLTIGAFGLFSFCSDLVLDIAKVDDSSTHTWEVLAKLPLELFLFFPALFILSQQLVFAGVVGGLARNLVAIAESPATAMTLIGFASMLAAQAVSTAPMTIIFLQVVTRVPGWGHPVAGTDACAARDLSLYALVLGSNFCGNISRMGTMGGQMWFRIARDYGYDMSDWLMLQRSAIMIPTMALALVLLYHGYFAYT